MSRSTATSAATPSRFAVLLVVIGGSLASGCCAVAFFSIGGLSGLLTVLSITAGFCVGVAWEDAWKLYRSSRKDALVAHDNETAAETTERHRFNGLGALAILLIISSAALAVCAVALLVTRQQVTDTQNRLTRYIDCTSSWQQQFSEGYFARYNAAVAVSGAMDKIVTGVSANNREEFGQAVREYVALREKQIAEQKANPLPPLPDQLCGDPK